ncbi:MAG: hypothetical protein J6N76_00885, partial [Lachnospiraceae bacterium]|nr:hypothetical protein [Lachnospiraceae bacterium]
MNNKKIIRNTIDTANENRRIKPRRNISGRLKSCAALLCAFLLLGSNALYGYAESNGGVLPDTFSSILDARNNITQAVSDASQETLDPESTD